MVLNTYRYDYMCIVAKNSPGEREQGLQPSQDTLLIDFSLTVKAATLIFIPWRRSAISSANEGKSGFIYNLVKNKYVVWAAQTCVHFMQILTVNTLNSHLLILKAHNHKMYVYCREAS